MRNLTTVGVKLAAALLLFDREISIADIRALPFVETDDDAQQIVGVLRRAFPLELVQRRDSVGAIPTWEDVLQLRDAA